MATETVVIRKDPPTYAYLIVAKGAQVGAIYQLRPETTTLGRGGECDIRLDDPTVSSQHARIRCEAGKAFTLVDLGTANGTKINGRRQQQHLLKRNDQIQLGETMLVFKQLG